MPVAIDTSVLIHAEKTGAFENLLPEGEATYYIPAHAAAEFLVGAHLPKSAALRERARRTYDTKFRLLVDLFDEADAAIAATAIARGDSLLAMDADFDRLKKRLNLIQPPE